MAAGETLWSIANMHGVGVAALRAANAGAAVDELQEGQPLRLPASCSPPARVCPPLGCLARDHLVWPFHKSRGWAEFVASRQFVYGHDWRCAESPEEHRERVLAAVKRATSGKDGPENGVVAVKVQYPDALPLFTQDLRNIRSLAAFISKTEIQFDLVSACDELGAQVKYEFNFKRCALSQA